MDGCIDVPVQIKGLENICNFLTYINVNYILVNFKSLHISSDDQIINHVHAYCICTYMRVGYMVARNLAVRPLVDGHSASQEDCVRCSSLCVRSFSASDSVLTPLYSSGFTLFLSIATCRDATQETQSVAAVPMKISRTERSRVRSVLWSKVGCVITTKMFRKRERFSALK